MAQSPHYQAYLLRLWQDNPTAGWQASLQAPGAAPLHRFADVQLLVAFLLAATGTPSKSEETSAQADYSSRKPPKSQGATSASS